MRKAARPYDPRDRRGRPAQAFPAMPIVFRCHNSRIYFNGSFMGEVAPLPTLPVDLDEGNLPAAKPTSIRPNRP